MGTEERKKREQKRRKNNIIAAAEKVINRTGFQQATMDEIAEEAELSKGTLYLYFSHKTALYFAINKKGLEKLHTHFVEIMEEDKQGIELVRNLGDTFVSFITQNPEYTKAMVYYESLIEEDQAEENKLAQECEEIGRQLLMYLTRAIQIGMQDGSVANQMEPKFLAVQFWASMRGMMQLYQVRSQNHFQKLLQDFELDMETMIRQFLRVHITGIQKSN